MTRGDIFVLDFGVPYGSEPGFKRPVIIVQSDKENLNTTIVIPLTSNLVNADLEGNLFISKKDSKLNKDSVALGHQIIVVDKFRLEEKISVLPSEVMKKIDSVIDYVLKD